MHEQRHARVHRRHHRRRADGVDLNHHARLLAFVHDGANDVHLLRGRAGHRRQGDLAGELDAQRRHLANLGARRVGRVLVEAQHARRDDARPVDLARLDAVAQRDVALGGPASREERGVAGLELGLHLLLFHRAGVEVPMRVDEAWHRRHALGVDRLAGRGCRRAGTGGDDLSAPHDDGAALDDGCVGADDADVGDRQVLR